MVSKITRKFSEDSDLSDEIGIISTDIVKAVLIGSTTLLMQISVVLGLHPSWIDIYCFALFASKCAA